MIRGGSRKTLLHDYRGPLCSGTRELGAGLHHVAHTPRLDPITPQETRRVNGLKKKVRELAVREALEITRVTANQCPRAGYVKGVEQCRALCLAGELSHALG